MVFCIRKANKCEDKYDHCASMAHECLAWGMWKDCPATCCSNCDCSNYTGNIGLKYQYYCLSKKYYFLI